MTTNMSGLHRDGDKGAGELGGRLPLGGEGAVERDAAPALAAQARSGGVPRWPGPGPRSGRGPPPEWACPSAWCCAGSRCGGIAPQLGPEVQVHERPGRHDGQGRGAAPERVWRWLMFGAIGAERWTASVPQDSTLSSIARVSGICSCRNAWSSEGDMAGSWRRKDAATGFKWCRGRLPMTSRVSSMSASVWASERKPVS